MNLSVNPEPHLENATPTTGLSSTESAVQYGKWGVGGCVTRRPISNSLRAQLPAIGISLLGSGSIDRPHFLIHRRKLQDVCELGEVERKLHRRWLLCFLNTQQFTHLLGLLSALRGDFFFFFSWAPGHELMARYCTSCLPLCLMRLKHLKSGWNQTGFCHVLPRGFCIWIQA